MRIGITGTFASGKGTVCSFFEKLGAIVIDTDILAKEAVSPGSDSLKKIIRVFGKSFISEEGFLKRRELGRYVFQNKSRTEKLNKILHPIILEKTLNLSCDKSKIFVINAPLLFEAGFDKYMEKTIVVKTDENKCIERGINRDKITEEEIRDRINMQFSVNKKIALADYVIDNSKDLNNTKTQVNDLWKIITNSLNKKTSR